jgi:hypothetical protein
MWPAEAEIESAENESEGAESYDHGESEDYGEESPAERRRRAQRRRVALRRQQELARARASQRAGVVPVRPSASAAIRTLDLETKVQDDRLRSTNAALNSRMNRSEYAAVVGAATNQFIESFQEPQNPYVRAGLRFAPLLLLSPQKRGAGLGAFVADPRVLGVAAVAAITFAGAHRDRVFGPANINILSADTLAANDNDRFVADVVDHSGKVLTHSVTWASDDPNVATIDPATGMVTAVHAGTAYISASFDGIVGHVRLKVE